MGKKKKNKGRPAATLALFAWGGLEPDTHDCIIAEMKEWPKLRHYRISGDALIDRARSRAASDFLNADPKEVGDVLLMVDHDIVWRRGDLYRLYQSCVKANAVVAGVYSKRNFGAGTAIRPSKAGEYKMDTDTLMPCHFVSTGFMAIPRNILAKLAEVLPYTIGNFWPFFAPAVVEHPIQQGAYEYLSEDWAFCRRAVDAGFQVFADLQPRLVHVGHWGFRVSDGIMQPPPEQPGTFIINDTPTNKALLNLMPDVSEYTGIALDALGTASVKARAALAEHWNRFGGYEKEEEWYSNPDVGKLYILDLAMWQSGQLSPVIQALSDEVQNGKVLDFGAGIGTMALALAERNRVHTVEINPEMMKFAAWRAERLGLEIDQLQAPDGPYDTIICFHVLEHLTDPLATARMLFDQLKPGGRLFSQSDPTRDTLHPMHREIDADAILREAGFIQEGPVWWRRGGDGEADAPAS